MFYLVNNSVGSPGYIALKRNLKPQSKETSLDPDIGFCGIAVLDNFSCGISVILIMNCGIAVFSKSAGCGFLAFWTG